MLAFSLALASFSPLVTRNAQAINDAWATTPANGNFSGINWTVGSTTPGAATGTAATGDSLFFGISSITALTNDNSGFTFAGLTFNTGASAYTIGGNAFTLTGAITNNSASTQTINAPITLGANENFNAAAGAITIGGAITNSGANTFGVALTGINAVTLSGANNFGSLAVGVGQAANANTNVAVSNGVGATVNLNSSQSVGALTVGNGASTINVGAGATITTTTLGQANTNDRFVALNINLGAGASVTTNATNTNGVIAVGSQFNILTLNGTDFAANGTNAAGGTLVAATYTPSMATTLGTASQNVNVVGDVAVPANTTINTLRFADTTGRTLTIGAGNTLSLNGTGGTGGSILMAATSGAVTNTITGGTLYGTSNRGYSFLNYDTNANANLVINSNLINAPISGSGLAATTSVLVAGGGKVTFGGTNVINGPLMIAGAGTNLSVASDANLGGFNSTVSVATATNGSTTVTLAAAPSTLGSLVAGDVLLGQTISNIVGTTVTLGAAYTGTSITTATTVGYAGGGSVNLNGGTLTATGTFALSETGTQAADTANGVTVVRNRNLGLGLSGGTIDVTAGNTLTVPGVISGSTGASPTLGALNKVDSGTLVLSGTAANTNVFLNNQAGTTVLNKTAGLAATTVTITGGTVQLGNPPAANNQQVTNLNVNGGTFDVNGINATNSTIPALNGTGGTITNTNATAATLYIGAGGATNTDNLAIASNITGALNLNIQGATASTRVVTFSGANTYTGTTTVGAGMLTIATNGALGRGATTVGAGATLTLASTVTSPTGTTGTSLILSATTSTVNLAATIPGTVQDTVGSLSIAGITQTTLGTYGSSTSGATFQFPEFTGNGVILLAAVPEPGTWALLLGGMSVAGFVLRQRRRTAA